MDGLWPGEAWPCWPGLARGGLACTGQKKLGLAGWPGRAETRAGLAWPGEAWSGLARKGLARTGQTRPGLAWPGEAWPGLAKPDLDRQGLACQMRFGLNSAEHTYVILRVGQILYTTMKSSLDNIYPIRCHFCLIISIDFSGYWVADLTCNTGIKAVTLAVPSAPPFKTLHG